jgi:uncharacterized protein
MTYLLDINGVMALMNKDHEHHERVHRFLKRRPFATCPLVQLGALRLLTRPRRLKDVERPPLETPANAWRKLMILRNTRARIFIPDELDCAAHSMPFGGLSGHRQWNDFYLVALAQKYGFMVATFDAGLWESFREVVKLIP